MKWVLFSSVSIATLSFYLVRKSHRNNVCKTFSDYYTDRDSNENCYYNPNADLTTNQIIERHGYPVEIYNSITDDGYIITLFRIPHGKTKSANNNEKPKQPVFLLSVTLNSDSFINTGKKSLGFILADAGSDVWLGNFRGTEYARKHVNLTLEESKFWDYSFHEIGIYDIPSQIDLVSQITKQKVVYIGFSLGTTSAFVYGSTYPEVAEKKIKMFIALAPTAYLSGCKSIICTYVLPNTWQYMKPVIDWFTYGQLYLRQPPRESRNVLCFPFPFQMNMCQILDMYTWGFHYQQNDPETLPITLTHNNDAISTKLGSHLVQLFRNGGKFDHYDYGTADNIKKYGTPEPPLYQLSNFRVPVYLIRGENDLLVTKDDVEKLNASLPEEVKPYDIYVVKYDKFNHGDFLHARDIVPLLYNHIVEFIGKL